MWEDVFLIAISTTHLKFVLLAEVEQVLPVVTVVAFVLVMHDVFGESGI
jgi:hypothetical protein